MSDSGFIVPCSEALRARLEARLPALPAARLATIAEVHVSKNEPPLKRARKGENKKRLEPGESADYLDVLLNRVDDLRTKLGNLPGTIETVLDEARVSDRLHINPITAARSALHDLASVIVVAERRGFPGWVGRPPSPNRFLIGQIAGVVRDAGLIADARPTGPLCIATKLILDDYGERHSMDAIREMVRKALKDGA